MLQHMREKQLQILYAVQVTLPFYYGQEIKEVILTMVLYERFDNGKSSYEWDIVRNYDYDENDSNLYIPENQYFTADERMYKAILSYAREKLFIEHSEDTDIVVGRPRIYSVSGGSIYKGIIMQDDVQFAHAILNNIASRRILEEYTASECQISITNNSTLLYMPSGSEKLHAIIAEQLYQNNDFDISFNKNIVSLSKNSLNKYTMVAEESYAIILDGKYLSGVFQREAETSVSPALALRFVSEDNALDFIAEIVEKVTNMDADIHVEKRLEKIAIEVVLNVSGNKLLTEYLPYIMMEEEAS